MTQNQIAWNNFQEAVRHNKEMERLTGEELAEKVRTNTANERIKQYQAEETARSNRVQEGFTGKGLVINETHYARQDAETARHDKVEEWGKYYDPLVREGKAANILETGARYVLIGAQTVTEGERAGNIAKDTELKGAQVIETLASAESKNAQTRKTNEEAAREYIQRQYDKQRIEADLAKAAAETEKIRADAQLKKSQKTESQSRSAGNFLNLVPKSLNILDDITKRIYGGGILQ